MVSYYHGDVVLQQEFEVELIEEKCSLWSISIIAKSGNCNYFVLIIVVQELPR